MKKLSKLSMSAIFLAAIFALSACGGAGSGSGQSGEQAPPPEPTQAESEAPPDGDESSQPEEAAPEEAAPSEDADDASSEEGVSSEAQSSGPSGPSATTIQGEEVSLGGGEVTALFFMAGW